MERRCWTVANPYIKLDFDWHADPKILDFQDRYGKAALVDIIDLYCVLGEFFGTVDLKDNAQRLRLQQVLGKRGKALESFIEKAASCGIVNEEAWRELGRVGSDRSIKDGTARLKRRRYAEEASQAAADRRRAKRESGGADGGEP